jgi:protoporphyrinogen oxidase
LWGKPCNQLSPSIGGRRLKGHNMKALLTEALLGEKARIEHLEGTSFYYPKLGIGMIMDKLASSCLPKNIRKTSKVTQIIHDRTKIVAIELNGDTRVPVDQVISSLPITDFLQIMSPSPPSQVLNMARRLAFRSMILVTVLLDRSSITRSATVYFPDAKYPFTRLYEPRNRSSLMSPKGKTSLVAEIPCQETDEFWLMSDQQLSDLVSDELIDLAWIKKGEIIDTQTVRLHYAYPILEVGYESKVAEIT